MHSCVSPHKTRHQHLIVLLLVVITAGAFWQVSQHDFVWWDDRGNVVQNPYLNPVTPANVAHFWQYPYLGTHRPLIYTTWAAIATVARLPAPRQPTILGNHSLDPAIYHVANLLLHILTVLVVFSLLSLLIKNRWAAGAGALLFAVHPAQVESVAWVTGMNEVLYGFFALLAVWQYLKYTLVRPERRNRVKQGSHYILATLCFGLALLTKPSAVIVPLIAWALDHWIIRRPVRQGALALLPWMILTIPFMLLTQTESATPRTPSIFVTPLWSRPLIAGDALAFYSYKVLLPLSMGIDYGRTPRFVLQHWWGYLNWLVPCLVALLLWRNRESRPHLMAAGAVFFAALLPVLGLVSFRFQVFSTVADRYLYLAMLGPALILAWGLSSLLEHPEKFAGRGKFMIALCMAMLFGCALWTTQQVQHWKNSFTLFEHAIRVNPNSWVAHFDLGVALYREGKAKQAETCFYKALRIVPQSSPTYNFLGLALLRQGRVEAAIRCFRQALKLDPGYPMLHLNMAIALDRQGNTNQAVPYLHKVLQLRPNSSGAHTNLAIVLFRQGRVEEAIREFRRAWWLQANYVPEDIKLGYARMEHRNLEEQIDHTLSIHPYYASALQGCGLFLSRQGKSEEAQVFFREALRVTPHLAHY